MTKEKISEGNKLISMFMKRYKKEEDISKDEDEIVIKIHYDGFSGSETSRETRPFDYSDLKYHISWDWIMPVIEKIEKIQEKDFFNVEVVICYNECSIGIVRDAEHFEGLIDERTDSKILSVYQAVVEFIKWYNIDYKEALNHDKNQQKD